MSQDAAGSQKCLLALLLLGALLFPAQAWLPGLGSGGAAVARQPQPTLLATRSSRVDGPTFRRQERQRLRGEAFRSAAAGAGGTEGEEALRAYMIKASEEKLRAVSQAKEDTRKEFEARLQGLEDKLQQYQGGGAVAAGGSVASDMLSRHEDRMKSIDTLREEIKVSYESHLEELMASLDNSSTGASAGGAAAADGAAGGGVALHPAYAMRTERPGWEERWGAEETQRMGIEASVTAPQPSSSAKAAAVAVHPAYAARTERPGWEGRWGPEEIQRMQAAAGAAPNAVAQAEQGSSSGDAAVAVHPAYAARTERPGWEGRWGPEEVQRMQAAAGGGAGGAAPGSASASTSSLQGSEAEELAELRKFAQEYVVKTHTSRLAQAQELNALKAEAEALRAERGAVREAFSTYMAKALAAKVEAVEQARSGVRTQARKGGAAPAAAPVVAAVAPPPPPPAAAAASPSGVHPAYAARLERPGWEERWGKEEKERAVPAMAHAGGTGAGQA